MVLNHIICQLISLSLAENTLFEVPELVNETKNWIQLDLVYSRMSECFGLSQLRIYRQVTKYVFNLDRIFFDNKPLFKYIKLSLNF